MRDKTANKLALEVLQKIKAKYSIESLEYWNCKPLAVAVGLKHDTLRKFLKRKFHKSNTKTLLLLCDFFDVQQAEKRKFSKPENSVILMAALRSVWDGSSDHELALAGLIRSAAAFNLDN